MRICSIAYFSASIALGGSLVSAFISPTSKFTYRDPSTYTPNQFSSAKRNSRLRSMTADEETSEVKKEDKNLMNVYVEYITKLWRQTDPEEREKVAAQQALYAIKRVKHIMEGEEYVDMSHMHEGENVDDMDERIEARDELKLACSKMLECLEKVEVKAPAMEAAVLEDAKNGEMTAVANVDESNGGTLKKKKKSRSKLFGASMGLIVACWVFSGNFLFTAAFTLMTALGQLEYYRMVMKTGIYPARRISVVGACSMFLTVS